MLYKRLAAELLPATIDCSRRSAIRQLPVATAPVAYWHGAACLSKACLFSFPVTDFASLSRTRKPVFLTRFRRGLSTRISIFFRLPAWRNGRSRARFSLRSVHSTWVACQNSLSSLTSIYLSICSDFKLCSFGVVHVLGHSVVIRG